MEFARMSEAELFALSRSSSDPAILAAVQAERERRRGVTNVDANLEAAATEIVPDPVAGEPSPRDAYAARLEAAGYTPREAGMAADYEGTMPGAYSRPESDETLRRGAAYMRDQDRREGRFDVSMAAAMGQDVPMPAQPSDTVTVEGFVLPSVQGAAGPLGDGQYYRMRDLNAAKAKAQDDARSAELSRQAQEDLAAYGTRQLFRYQQGPDGELVLDEGGRPIVEEMPSTGPEPGMNLTAVEEDQQDRLAARRRLEQRQAAQNRALRNRPGMRQYDEDRAVRRARYSDMARLAGGSSGLRGGPGGNIGMFQALAMLQGVDPENMDARQMALAQNLPIDPRRAQIEQAHNAQLTQLGLRVAQGQGFQQPTPAEQRLGEARATAAEREANPDMAAISDIQEGIYTSEAARAHLTALGKPYDTVWLGGASEDRKPELVARLTQPPYNLPPARAQEVAGIALATTRWWNRPF